MSLSIVQSEINDLKLKLQSLETQQRYCQHVFGEVQYNPYTKKEERYTGRYETQGIHIHPIIAYIDVAVPRWSRTCSKCGMIQYSENSNK